MIAIVDYGMGNLRSVHKALNRIGAEAIISSDRKVISTADKIILPGVGHFKEGMKNLGSFGLIEVLNEAVNKNIPLLGICLGMQLLTNHSEEGEATGLGWIDAKTIRFNFGDREKKLRVPHIGWNSVKIERPCELFSNVGGHATFYFVHSYYVECSDPGDVVTTTNYGIPFASSVRKNNIFGTQFHPEKSHDDGLIILRNFAALP